MEKLKDSQVWTLNTKTWTWELEGYRKTGMVEDGSVEKLLILLVIVGVILVLIVILAFQISRSYFSRKSADTDREANINTEHNRTVDQSRPLEDKNTEQYKTGIPSKYLNELTESPPYYYDVVLNIDLNEKEDPPTYSQLFI